MKQYARFFLIELIVGIALILTALLPCRPLAADGGRVLRLASKYSDAKSLDPHRATASQDRLAVALMFDALVRYPAGNLSADAIMPDLAIDLPSPAVLADGRQQWIFKLKKGVLTHPYAGKPGYELTAEDVVFSLQRAADPKRSSFAIEYGGMDFKALDKYRVQITLQQPISAFLFLPKFANRGGGFIVPKKVIEEQGEEWFKTNPVGTGPFIFQKYIPAEKIVFTANKNFFRGAPKLAGVEWYYMPNDSSREMALRKGELDVIEGPKEQAWAEKMSGISEVEVETTGSAETVIAHFNMSLKPLDQLKVRQAMAYAMNRKEYIAVYGTKVSYPIYSVVPGNMVAGLTKEEVRKKDLAFEFNIEKAKKLLAEAGFPKGFTLDVFTSESATYKRAYELFQAQMRRIGIDVKLSVVDHSTFHERIRQNLNPIVFYAAMRENPDVILTQFYHSDSIVSTGKKAMTNFSHIGEVDADGDGKIDSIDDLIMKARVEREPAKQTALWKEAQIDLLEKMASYPILTIGYVFAKSPSLKWGFDMVNITDGPNPTEATGFSK